MAKVLYEYLSRMEIEGCEYNLRGQGRIYRKVETTFLCLVSNLILVNF